MWVMPRAAARYLRSLNCGICAHRNKRGMAYMNILQVHEVRYLEPNSQSEKKRLSRESLEAGGR